MHFMEFSIKQAFLDTIIHGTPTWIKLVVERNPKGEMQYSCALRMTVDFSEMVAWVVADAEI